MEGDRVLRPRGRGRNNQSNTTTTTTTGTTTTTNTIPPLMSAAFPPLPAVSQQYVSQQHTTQNNTNQQINTSQHVNTSPQNSSTTGTDNTIISPQYTSTVAHDIRNQFDSLRLSQRVGDGNNTVVNNDGITLREYVSASVSASQARIMNHIRESLQQMVPQLVREILRADTSFSYDTLHHTPHQQPARNIDNMPRPQDEQRRQEYQQSFNMQTPATHYLQKSCSPSDLEKWGIKFDGSRKSFTVEDFVFRVESLQIDNNCPMTTLMKGFHHLLTGSAYEWFWTFRRENPYCEWSQLKCNLIRKFRRFESDTEIQRCIMERKQNSTESSEVFISEIITLKNQLSRSIREEELVRIVKDNLKDGLYQLIYPINIRSFDHLLDECRRAECNLAKRSHNRPFPTRRINEINYNQSEEEYKFEIEALKAMPPAKQLICWNCKTAGHSFIECSVEQRNIFCYRCGFEDVVTPKCPRCTGNKVQNMS